MIDRASTPFLALQGERTAQDGFKMVRSVVLGGILNAIMRKMESRLITLTRQSFPKGFPVRFINKVLLCTKLCD